MSERHTHRLDEGSPALDRRIIAALQIRPRATWAAIADALGESARSVSRRGTELLDSGAVRVVGVRGATGTAIARIRSSVGAVRTVASGLAARPYTVFSYATTGAHSVFAEIRIDAEVYPGLVFDELPAVNGIADVRIDTVTRNHRSVSEWRPAVLTPAEAQAMGEPGRPPAPPQAADHEELSPSDRMLLRLLAEDARMTTADLAAHGRVSENTVRRRLAWLEQHSYLRIRVVAEPELLGFPVEALVTVTAARDAADRLVAGLLARTETRYLSALGGDRHLLAHFAFRNMAALHTELSSAPWTAEAESFEVSHVLQAFKRSGWSRTQEAATTHLY
ncbi:MULTISPECIES: Lrp/AsnC family transcriptional regulator [Brevibacterium]|uniref:Lrp/AsnC family transcriptional regulator n=1 Tax=Brevibacterium salitolerans TaxID=1403566 RepID=A0ABN2WLN6_9MICO|nr:Lrp/AsnC family transcriptional regulator [Brevibacterium sp.]